MVRLSRKWVIPATISLLGAAAFVLIFSILLSNRRQTELSVGKELQAVAVSAAARISAPAYESLFFDRGTLRAELADTPKDPRFTQVQKALRETSEHFTYLKLGQDNIYTFLNATYDNRTPELFWGVMLHATPFTGEAYSPPEAAKQVLARVQPGFSGVYLSSASKREWISGYAPIVHRGKVIGMVEVAREISEVLETARDSILPVILISLGILFLCAMAIIVITQFARTLQKTNTNLNATVEKLTQSNAVSRHLRESSSDIIFALGNDLKVASINAAARRQLGINIDAAIGQPLTEVLCNTDAKRAADNLFDPELLRRALENLRTQGEKVNLTATLSSRLTGEPKDFRIRVERVSDSADLSYIGRAVSLGDMMVASLVDRTRATFKLNNSLLMTEELATFLSALCRRFLDEHKVTTYRIMLREMLLNAIEHGNLEINFEEKTHALMTESYFDLIDERRRQDPYRNRQVTVDCLIERSKIAFRITDEGQGFDHRSMIAKLTDETNDTAHGRGIIMTIQEFDRVQYNAKGNSVTMVKYLSE